MARPGARATLGASLHGKDRVRVAKVRRGADGVHQFAELAVRVELVGGTDAAYVRGDNSMVVATDTCKNHVYMLAKTHACGTPEHFGADLAESFLAHYAHVRAAAVTVTEVPWRRVRTAGGAEHNHGFIRHADGGRAARAVATRVPGRQRPALELTSTLTGLNVLKTTQSGWSDFHDSRFRTLPDTDERILATSVKATWTYAQQRPGHAPPDYASVHERVRAALVASFYGPAGGGEFSRGVQESLFKMGGAALTAAPEIARITLDLPNLHFLPANLAVFEKNAVAFDDDVYVPSAEPHGIICATVERPALAKL